MAVFCKDVGHYLSLVDDESLLNCSLEYLEELYFTLQNKSMEREKKAVVLECIRGVCPAKDVSQPKSKEEIQKAVDFIIARSKGISNISQLLQEHIGVAESSDLATISEIGLTDKLEVRDDEQGNFEKDVFLMDTASDLKKRVRHHSSLEGPPCKKMTSVKLFSSEAKQGFASFFSALTSDIIEKEFEKDTKILELEKSFTSLKDQVISLTNDNKQLKEKFNRKAISNLKQMLYINARNTYSDILNKKPPFQTVWDMKEPSVDELVNLGLRNSHAIDIIDHKKLSNKLDSLLQNGKFQNFQEHFQDCNLSIIEEVVSEVVLDGNYLKTLENEFI